MLKFKSCLVYMLLITASVLGKHKKAKHKKVPSPGKGLQCYNCLSYDHPGCWDPDHPHYANITVPNINCYIPGMDFLCIIITSESAKLVETGQEVGPVRARTCVPARDFTKRAVSYPTCNRVSRELAASEIFSRVEVTRPQCVLCKKHLCTDAPRC